ATGTSKASANARNSSPAPEATQPRPARTASLAAPARTCSAARARALASTGRLPTRRRYVAPPREGILHIGGDAEVCRPGRHAEHGPEPSRQLARELVRQLDFLRIDRGRPEELDVAGAV